jgi:probable biosynthetic protein (TIGR04098 family)
MKMDVMSSFSRIQEPGNSRSLVKGQPAIPVDFALPSASALPAMAQEYRSLRAAEPDTPIRTCDYQINPVHDINGVGLLYFASYPIIVETCLRRFWREEALWSPVARDCCYFANSGPDETLEFGLISFEVSGDRARAVCSLTRQDGTRMALVSTDFARVGATSSRPLQEHDRTGSTRERAEAELAA